MMLVESVSKPAGSVMPLLSPAQLPARVAAVLDSPGAADEPVVRGTPTGNLIATNRR